MKVIDLTQYRARKLIETLEKRVGQLALSPKIGSINEMKTCFREWLRMTNH